MNYDKTNPPQLDKPAACSFCGSIEVAAFWQGAEQILVCQKCAKEVLPVLLADSIPGDKLRADPNVNAIIYPVESQFQAAFRKALLTRFARWVQQMQKPKTVTVRDINVGTEERLLATIDFPDDASWCDNCKHLTPTEAEQDAEHAAKPDEPRGQHICMKHGWTLEHQGQHPRIPKPPTCEGPYLPETPHA